MNAFWTDLRTAIAVWSALRVRHKLSAHDRLRFDERLRHHYIHRISMDIVTAEAEKVLGVKLS